VCEVRFYFRPLHTCNGLERPQYLELLLATQEFVDRGVPHSARSRGAPFQGQRDAYADLNPKTLYAVPERVGLWRTFPADQSGIWREIACQLFAHPVECYLVDEAVVACEAHDAVPLLKAICRPPEELDIRIG